MNWLAPTPQQLTWLSPEQRQKEWTGYTPMPISTQRHAWDGTLFYSYGYGWRIADVDGQMTVSHTGTLSGMYSAMTLLPFRKSGYVFLIDADADDARTVLNEVLTKTLHRTAESPQLWPAMPTSWLAMSSSSVARAYPIRPHASPRRPTISRIGSACGAIRGSARCGFVRAERRCSSPRRNRPGWPDRSCGLASATWSTGASGNSEAWLQFPDQAGRGAAHGQGRSRRATSATTSRTSPSRKSTLVN